MRGWNQPGPCGQHHPHHHHHSSSSPPPPAPAPAPARHGGAGGFCHQHCTQCTPTVGANGATFDACTCGCTHNPSTVNIPHAVLLDCINNNATPEECTNRLHDRRPGTTTALRATAARLAATGELDHLPPAWRTP